MKSKLFLLLVVVCLFNGCGRAFTPKEYAPKKGLINAFNVNGAVAFNNAQPSKDIIAVYSEMGTKVNSNLNLITQGLANQAATELKKHGVIKTGTANKTIALKVSHILSSYKFYFYKSSMTYSITLGNGKQIDKTVQHGSGSSLDQDLNGCIAEGVIELFKDKAVLDYLAE
jgi:hypothetical protein